MWNLIVCGDVLLTNKVGNVLLTNKVESASSWRHHQTVFGTISKLLLTSPTVNKKNSWELGLRWWKWGWDPMYCSLMPQSHHTSGPCTGCSRTVLNKIHTGPGTHSYGAVLMSHRTRPVEVLVGAYIIRWQSPYEVRGPKQPMRQNITIPTWVRAVPIRVVQYPYGLLRFHWPVSSRAVPVR